MRPKTRVACIRTTHCVMSILIVSPFDVERVIGAGIGHIQAEAQPYMMHMHVLHMVHILVVRLVGIYSGVPPVPSVVVVVIAAVVLPP